MDEGDIPPGTTHLDSGKKRRPGEEIGEYGPCRQPFTRPISVRKAQDSFRVRQTKIIFLRQNRGKRGPGSRASCRIHHCSAHLTSHQSAFLSPEDGAKESRAAFALDSAMGLQDAPGLLKPLVSEMLSASVCETEPSQTTTGKNGEGAHSPEWTRQA